MKIFANQDEALRAADAVTDDASYEEFGENLIHSCVRNKDINMSIIIGFAAIRNKRFNKAKEDVAAEEWLGFKVGDKVQKKDLPHTLADDTIFTILHIVKTPLQNGYYDNGFFIETGGTPTEFVMRAKLSDGSCYGLTNIIKV
jgi:hypothetical protein